MLASIAKTVQLNSQEIEERKNNKTQVEKLQKEKEETKGRLMNKERIKRSWYLRLKVKKKKEKKKPMKTSGLKL